MTDFPLILASASPRRRDLLTQAGIPFTVIPSHADELTEQTLPVGKLVTENALRKAMEVSARYPGRTVLGSDTLVTADGKVLGKPKDREDAKRMLRFLSGRTHEVLTGIALTDGTRTVTDLTETKITFFPLDEQWIERYVSTGECDDKAGAYGIQGKGGLFVQAVEGDYYSVVGLPIGKVYKILSDFSREMPIDKK